MREGKAHGFGRPFGRRSFLKGSAVAAAAVERGRSRSVALRSRARDLQMSPRRNPSKRLSIRAFSAEAAAADAR